MKTHTSESHPSKETLLLFERAAKKSDEQYNMIMKEFGKIDEHLRSLNSKTATNTKRIGKIEAEESNIDKTIEQIQPLIEFSHTIKNNGRYIKWIASVAVAAASIVGSLAAVVHYFKR